jgi:hypothetical protein
LPPDRTDAESRWLVRGLAALFLFVFVVVIVAWPVAGWPADTVANVCQLLGLGLAALAIPVVSPWMAHVERKADVAKAATRRRLSVARAKLRAGWARVRGVTTGSGTVHLTLHGTGTASGSLTLDVSYGGETRDLAIRALREIQALRQALEEFKTTSREETERRIDALRTELQEHVLSVTREGWHYVIGGAGLTAVGIAIALFAPAGASGATTATRQSALHAQQTASPTQTPASGRTSASRPPSSASQDVSSLLDWATLGTSVVGLLVAGLAFWFAALRRARVEIDRLDGVASELATGGVGGSGLPTGPHVAVYVFVANSGASGTVVTNVVADAFVEENEGAPIWSGVARTDSTMPSVLALERDGAVSGTVAVHLAWNNNPAIADADEYARRLRGLRAVSVTVRWKWRRSKLPTLRKRETVPGELVVRVPAENFVRQTVEHWRTSGFGNLAAVFDAHEPADS